MNRLAAFEAERRRLFGVAYRMTGSVAEAEDIVQEGWLRFSGLADDADPNNPAAWLTTVVTRLAIDRLRSARATRETYVGPWLPEPVVTDDDPAEKAVLAESLSFAFLTVLERLDPIERAAFLLREVFGFSYADVAATIDRNETACRQIVHRAKARIAPERPPRYAPTAEEEQRLLDGFFGAILTGDVIALADVLAADCVAWSDGGPNRRAARRPIVGRDRVITYVSNLSRPYLDPELDATAVPVRVNGQPGAILSLGGDIEMVMVFEIGDGAIVALRSVLNPRKLDHLRG